MDATKEHNVIIVRMTELGEINRLLRECFLLLEKHSLFTDETKHLRKGIREHCIKFEDLQNKLEAYNVEGTNNEIKKK